MASPSRSSANGSIPASRARRRCSTTTDIAGIQALAVKQAEAGARYLNVNIGARALTDAAFMATVDPRHSGGRRRSRCRSIFRAPTVQKVCLEAYDRAKAGGAAPIVNSITEHRWDLMDLYKPYGPFKVVLMASERVEDGQAKGNKTAQEIYDTARRCALRLAQRATACRSTTSSSTCPSARSSPTPTGLNRATLDADPHDRRPIRS